MSHANPSAPIEHGRRKGQRSPVASEPSPNQLALNANQVAWLLGVSPNTVWNMLSDGRLSSFSVGRRRLISRSAVEKFIAASDPSNGRP